MRHTNLPMIISSPKESPMLFHIESFLQTISSITHLSSCFDQHNTTQSKQDIIVSKEY